MAGVSRALARVVDSPTTEKSSAVAPRLKVKRYIVGKLFLWRQLTLRGRLALATEQRQRGTWTYNPETHELVLSAEVER